ncbi:DinB family protein [Flagellimonas halotolerans]|uniref:DinB family protein n=1 Tax=Flagellimonas halotolerans TaxID=3112164 RepID=A0ABU6IN90_9FLAO|nr:MULTISPECIES: DinB family protein [unclassified Allomuricauda]MEC3964615.1 DinB family protein [Muricauda sp. SYSU M86414]MEC4264484.1 DinB family protein [Muricauda sp. SYSU M84420]
MDKEKQLQEELVWNAGYRMNESLRMIKICLGQLTEDEIWQKPNESSNSIGNLILHLCGNITQYGIASIQNLEDNRQRDEEFSTVSGYTKAELVKKLEDTISDAKRAFYDAPLNELLRKRNVQGFNFSGVGNIIHVTEHLSYHTGQIALWTKILQNKDLGFYGDVDLNIKNETKNQ